MQGTALFLQEAGFETETSKYVYSLPHFGISFIFEDILFDYFPSKPPYSVFIRMAYDLECADLACVLDVGTDAGTDVVVPYPHYAESF